MARIIEVSDESYEAIMETIAKMTVNNNRPCSIKEALDSMLKIKQ